MRSKFRSSRGLPACRRRFAASVKRADIRAEGEFYYFDLRPFDARNGRVAVKDLRNLKTNAAGRVIPIHPLLIELGLLDRMQDLMDKKEERLFPEWDAYIRKNGTIRWSQPLGKAWQYVKTMLKLNRADLTLYSTRHLMADWLDNEAIAQRTRATAFSDTPVTSAGGGCSMLARRDADRGVHADRSWNAQRAWSQRTRTRTSSFRAL